MGAAFNVCKDAIQNKPWAERKDLCESFPERKVMPFEHLLREACLNMYTAEAIGYLLLITWLFYFWGPAEKNKYVSLTAPETLPYCLTGIQHCSLGVWVIVCVHKKHCYASTEPQKDQIREFLWGSGRCFASILSYPAKVFLLSFKFHLEVWFPLPRSQYSPGSAENKREYSIAENYLNFEGKRSYRGWGQGFPTRTHIYLYHLANANCIKQTLVAWLLNQRQKEQLLRAMYTPS